jgi:hypothetical protein
MLKNYFHNSKLLNENKDKKKSLQTNKNDIRKAVDINILLNKVKIKKKSEAKRKIFFYSFVTLIVGLFGTFISIIK